eukprot:scaffold350119_cov142-Cyclotella_meneghiniana.AAC.1
MHSAMIRYVFAIRHHFKNSAASTNSAIDLTMPLAMMLKQSAASSIFRLSHPHHRFHSIHVYPNSAINHD